MALGEGINKAKDQTDSFSDVVVSSSGMVDTPPESSSDAENNSKDKLSSPESSPVQSPAEPALNSSTEGAQKIMQNGDPDIFSENCFTVKIIAPGVESFDLQVSANELVHEIHQILMEREDTCHRTCFSLQLDGVTIDNFQELKTFAGLKDSAVLRVVDEPYTTREARLHVQHLRNLLATFDPAPAYQGQECASLTFATSVVGSDLFECGPTGFGTNGSRSPRAAASQSLLPDGTLTTSQIDHTPPSYLVPGISTEPPLLPIFLTSPASSPNQQEVAINSSSVGGQSVGGSVMCLKSLQYSAWNPPVPNRKLHGDLLYLEVRTLEDKDYHITCCPKGFFVNQSTQTVFNPKPAVGVGGRPGVHHPISTLIDLLNQISPLFRRNFSQLLKRRSSRHPFERVPTALQVYAWLAPNGNSYHADNMRAEQASFPWKINCDDHIPYQNRDWNEEVQATREMSKQSLTERVPRERAMYKVDCDFAQAAVQGAINVVDGNIMAINPGETPRCQMFIWNNIFFSLGFEVKDHFKEFGGDSAAHVSPANDLKGIVAYAAAGGDNLHTLATAVIDYRGYRVVAQSIVPGILEKEQEQLVVYGSYDFGKTVVVNDKYHDLLKASCQALRIRPHKVLNHKDEEVTIYSSVDTKGIVGNDRRDYILDLLNTMPPDINFRPDVTGVIFSQKCQEAGFPRPHPHKLAQYRQEFLEAFVEDKYVQFVSLAASKLSSAGKQQQAKSQEQQETASQGDSSLDSAAAAAEQKASKDKEDAEQKSANAKKVIMEACAAVGSLSETDFDISFNPDMFHPVARLADAMDELEKQAKLLASAADFMVATHIPAFVDEIRKFSIIPVDGASLTEHMHRHGINVRYLGEVLRHLESKPAVRYAAEITIAEIITRCAKHVFRSYMQSVDPSNLAAAVSHFLNCYFSTPASVTPSGVAFEELAANAGRSSGSSNSKRKGKGKSSVQLGHNWDVYDGTWSAERITSIWTRIVDRSRSYFGVDIPCYSFQDAASIFGLRAVPMLRAFCRATGVQLSLKDFFYHRQLQVFREDDIRGLYPLVRHTLSKASDPYSLLARSHVLIGRRAYKEAVDVLNEALTLFSNIYGAMHVDICLCLKIMARLYYITLDFGEAVTCQHRVVVMTERLFGVDHPNVIGEYTNFALYCAAVGLLNEAVRLMYRARYLSILCHSERHPNIAIIDTQLGVLLLGLQDCDMSLRYLENALDLFRGFFGEKSDQFALCRHLMARVYAQRGDFKSAIHFEGVAYELYKEKYGVNDDRVRESMRLRQLYTQQAIDFERTLRDLKSETDQVGFNAKSGNSGKSQEKPGARSTFFLRPLTISALIDMLNVIHGLQPVIAVNRVANVANDGTAAADGSESSDVAVSHGNLQPATTVHLTDAQLYYLMHGLPAVIVESPTIASATSRATVEAALGSIGATGKTGMLHSDGSNATSSSAIEAAISEVD